MCMRQSLVSLCTRFDFPVDEILNLNRLSSDENWQWGEMFLIALVEWNSLVIFKILNFA
jgi:hypothetical protein